MKTFEILVDFASDANTAGYSREEAEDLGAAWRGALAWLCEQLGIEAEPTWDHGRATQTPIGRDGEPVETVLWQAAHDCLSRDGEAELGERWQWAEKPAVVEALRRTLASAIDTDAA